MQFDHPNQKMCKIYQKSDIYLAVIAELTVLCVRTYVPFYYAFNITFRKMRLCNLNIWKLTVITCTGCARAVGDDGRTEGIVPGRRAQSSAVVWVTWDSQTVRTETSESRDRPNTRYIQQTINQQPRSHRGAPCQIFTPFRRKLSTVVFSSVLHACVVYAPLPGERSCPA